MRKNKTVQFDLNGEIRLLLNRNIVKFASRDGKWEMSFGEGTMAVSYTHLPEPTRPY